jgi:hypothetical protein
MGLSFMASLRRAPLEVRGLTFAALANKPVGLRQRILDNLAIAQQGDNLVGMLPSPSG